MALDFDQSKQNAAKCEPSRHGKTQNVNVPASQNRLVSGWIKNVTTAAKLALLNYSVCILSVEHLHVSRWACVHVHFSLCTLSGVYTYSSACAHFQLSMCMLPGEHVYTYTSARELFIIFRWLTSNIDKHIKYRNRLFITLQHVHASCWACVRFQLSMCISRWAYVHLHISMCTHPVEHVHVCRWAHVHLHLSMCTYPVEHVHAFR